MLGSLFIKPEGTAVTGLLRSGLSEAALAIDNLELRQLCIDLERAIHSIQDSSVDVRESILRVEKGIISPSLFDVTYQDHLMLSDEVKAKMRKAYINNPYALVFFDFASDVIGTRDMYVFLQDLKGKMHGEDPDKATGLRGHLLRSILRNVPYLRSRYSSESEWRNTGNFIHIPDTEEESKDLYDYVVSKTRSDIFMTLHDSLHLNISGIESHGQMRVWDLNQQLDAGLFIDQERTDTEVGFIENELGAIGSHPRIFDIGCGNGRIALELAKKGYDVRGFDFNGSEIEVARERAKRASLENVSFDVQSYSNFSADHLNGPQDGALMIYGVLNDMSIDEVVNLLKKVSKSLREGGKFILDLLNKNLVMGLSTGQCIDLKKLRKIKDPSLREVKRSRHISDDQNFEITRFCLEYSDGTSEEVVYMQRLFSKSDIMKMLEDVGFTGVEVYGGFRYEEFTDSSKRMLIIATK